MYLRRSVLKDRLYALTRLHSELDQEIRDELDRPRPDAVEIQTLKRMHGRVQQRITLLSNQLELLEDTPARIAA